MRLLATEHQEQAAVIAWAHAMTNRWPELALLYAIPNGARTSWRTACRLKAEGMQRGVPDLHLPVARQGFHGLWLEMKRQQHSEVSRAQHWWHARLLELGHRVEVCRGAEEGIAVLWDYLSHRR